jgi:hypothetical protein
LCHQPDGSDFLGDEHASIGQERHAPGQIERRHRGHRERQVRLRRQVARVDPARAADDTSVSNIAAFRIFVFHESFSLEKDVGTKDRFYPGILTVWREVA